YNARSRIIHEGKWSETKLVIREKQLHSSPASTEYDSLIHYGWLIFRICLNSVLTGLSHASAINLQARFYSNKDRLERISKILETYTDSHEALNSILEDIRILADERMQDEHPLQLDLVYKVARLLAGRLILVVE